MNMVSNIILRYRERAERFNMKVTNEVCYRARITSGIILEHDNLKDLFRHAVRELRNEYGNSLFFECGKAEIEYGIDTQIEVRPGYYKGSFTVLRKICEIDICCIDRKTHIIYRRA